MKRYFNIGIFLIIILSVAIVVYAKINIDETKFEESVVNFKYDSLPSSLYNEMFDFEQVFVANEVKNVDVLYDISDYVLIVTINKKELVGKGIINEAKVKKVIKGSNITFDDTIFVYDLVAFIGSDVITYLDGSTPLKKGEDYIIFVNKTSRANVKNSFIATNTQYSYVSLNELNILDDYKSYSKSIEEISNYQYVFLDNDIDKINEYRNFILEIKNKYGGINND